MREKGWDEGCGGRKAGAILICAPSPQPLSREGRGAVLNAKLHVFSQTRNVWIR
ncbi:protein of unknown function [Azospirillum lipoferum 4B]|uniref:Uncharacterized protein n=1 Tax=Azospirillum lipoferum (strain 4B) TaxID=862719 RepID=G7Z7Y9_AZOL4|nr:protein of unknown function [Azospirillum lipoferum 4B]